MVKTVNKHTEKYYVCTECNFAYKEKTWAEKCENWCKEKHSCSLEITKQAIQT